MPVRPCRSLLVAVWLLVCAAPPALWRADQAGGGWAAAVAALVALLALPLLSRHILLRGPQAPRRLQWDGQGGFQLTLAGGYSEAVCLQRTSLVSARWLWLVVQGRRRHTLFFDRQQLDPAAYVALRRYLRTFRTTHGQ